MLQTKNYYRCFKKVILSLLIGAIFGVVCSSYACTTVSGIAKNGHVWTANNEDGPFGVANFINVFPRSGSDKYGYYTLSYMSPRYGKGGSIQGGMNEAGLSFDFDAIPYVESFDPESRISFQGGNDAILPYILGNLETVEEVITFFETYWFVGGFRNAQMHVSDKNGRFAIISASGIKMAEKGDFLVSTNFDICAEQDASSCWRYAIAVEKLSKLEVSFETMQSICRETAQKNGGTMYSNIQNLTTGDIWFFSKHDAGNIIKTNLINLISKGQKSYTFSDLKSLQQGRPERERRAFEKTTTVQTNIEDFLGTYEHAYIGPVNVQSLGNGIEITFVDGTNEVLYPTGINVFSLPDYDLYIKFEKAADTGTIEMSLYENGFWSFTVRKSESNSARNESGK